MAEWVCSKCGYTRDSRCKPKVCPECDAAGAFDKKEDTKAASKVPAKKAAVSVPAKKPRPRCPQRKHRPPRSPRPRSRQRNSGQAALSFTTADTGPSIPRWRKPTGAARARRGVGDPLDGLVLTILSQNTSDVNSDRAFARLKQELPTWREVLDADFERVEEAIRPGGISRIKAERIQQVLGVIEKELGTFDLRVMDEWGTERILDFMVALPGVGRKTAHVVLLFYFDRPAFPVDTHISRITRRLGWVPEKADLDKAHLILDSAVPDEVKGRLHLNFISHGRAVCIARRPRCGSCVISINCPRIGVGN